MAPAENHMADEAMDTTEDTPVPDIKEPSSQPLSPNSKPTIWIQEPLKEQVDEDKSVQSDSISRTAEVNPGYTMTVVSSRRNANGTIGSVYSGNKIRHLKKEDGVPLWRKDIQYSFLRAVFEDQTAVFTDIDGSKNHTFADIYINAMARSSKTSRVLREKLLNEREPALNMAMICLLVNVGRMNTTLNFFPEMRAQLRTYHAIPCLQKNQEPNAQYKGLQDAPRLKSILKGSCEDTDQPNTIEKIQAATIPRTNPVNLIFVLSQFAPKISEQHFFQPRDFFDLVIRATLSSKSRAKAFLWLIWWYLESDFSREAAEMNPFGPGLPPEENSKAMPIKVPAFEHLTEDQANAENVDTEEELIYGEKMKGVRKRILEDDETVGPPLKKTAGPSPARSEAGRTRSPSPAGTPSALNPARPRKLAANPSDTRSEMQPAARLILKTGKQERAGEPSPMPPGAGHTVLNSATPHARRARPETSHQKAVNVNRKMRIDKILYEQCSKAQKQSLKRKNKGPSKRYQEIKRIFYLPELYDSEEEEQNYSHSGLVSNRSRLEDDVDEDFGGEALEQKKVIDRAVRRVGRQDGSLPSRQADESMESSKPMPATANGSRVSQLSGAKGKGRNSSRNPSRRRSLQPLMPSEAKSDALDDLDMDLLGEGNGGIEYESSTESDSDVTEPYLDHDFSYADPYATVR